MTSSNIDVIRAFHGAYNRRDPEGALALFADEWEWIHMPDGKTFRGRDGLIEAWDGWFDAMPDASVEIQHLVDGGNWVVAELIVRGTHTGPMDISGGVIPPSGRELHLPTCDVVRLADGKMDLGRSYYDDATIREQLKG